MGLKSFSIFHNSESISLGQSPPICQLDSNTLGAFGEAVKGLYVLISSISVNPSAVSIGNKARIKDFRLFECYDNRFKG